jgi:hypothetical protein
MEAARSVETSVNSYQATTQKTVKFIHVAARKSNPAKRDLKRNWK